MTSTPARRRLRYEMVDGVLLVSPAPVPLHQRVVTRLTAAPLLVAEVLSERTHASHRTLKRHLSERAGVASYRILDPREPSLTVLELASSRYVEVAVVRGEQSFDAVRPFPVRVVPGELVR